MPAKALREKKATLTRVRLAMRAASRDIPDDWGTPGRGTLVEETKAAWARAGLQWGAHVCERCRHYDAWQVKRHCVNRCCTIMVHPHCGTEVMSWGPVFCGCNGKRIRLFTLNRRSARRWR